MTAKTSGQLKISVELAEKLPSEVCQCEIALHIVPDSRSYSQRFGTVDTKLLSTVADAVLIVAKDGFIPRHLKQEVKSLTLVSLDPKSLPAAGRHCSDSLRASAPYIYLPSVRHTHRLGAAA